MPTHFQTGIIVIHQLPKRAETLWLRLLGKGKVQSTAIAEVAALSAERPFREQALSWLGNLKVILEAREHKELEEEELMMQLSPLFLEKIQEAEAKGKAEGEIKEAQALILRQLTRRIGKISGELLSQVESLPLVQLEELGEALLDFTTQADLAAWLNQN